MLAGCGDLVLQRVGYDGAGDGHGRVPTGRMDGDNADDLVSVMRGDDAGVSFLVFTGSAAWYGGSHHAMVRTRRGERKAVGCWRR